MCVVQHKADTRDTPGLTRGISSDNLGMIAIHTTWTNQIVNYAQFAAKQPPIQKLSAHDY